jgi:hypothetical protein
MAGKKTGRINKKGAGRKELHLCGKDVYDLAKINCSQEEIANIVGCSVDTLVNKFSEVIESGRVMMRQSLKRKQYQMAMEGDRTMLIWLGKQYLGQTEKIDKRIEGNVSNVAISVYQPDDIPALAQAVTAVEAEVVLG